MIRLMSAPAILALGTPHVHAVLLLFAVLLAAGALFCLLLTLLMALSILTPPRMRDGRALFHLRRLTPDDLHLPYRDMNFTVKDHRTNNPPRLTAWWIESPQPSDRTIILIHGYSDSKIGALAWAPLFHSLNFNVLAVDQRAHGESQGRLLSAGFHERHDFTQLIDQLKTDQPNETHHIVLFGVSLGAATAAATAAIRTDISAIILECPFTDFPSAVISHAQNLPIPGRFFQKKALWFAEKIARADFSQVRPVDLIPKIPCPIFIIQSTDDPFVSAPNRDAIAHAVASRNPSLPRAHLWRAEGSFHVLALSDRPEEYKRSLTEFLTEALPPPTSNRQTQISG
jgi:pimeloyl-ACP methyl ester carboxylesterase